MYPTFAIVRQRRQTLLEKSLKNKSFSSRMLYSMVDLDKREQELGSFRKLDDGYKKIVITMDDDPFTLLENGYRKLNAIDFLLNETALEEI